MASVPSRYENESRHIIDVEPEPECCIYKAPENLRKGKPEAYTPNLISIGPIHHGKPELRQMEEQKSTYLRFFLERLSTTQEESRFNYLKSYRDYLGNKEEKIRRCYSEKYPKLSKDQFVAMILLDTVFIMELFLRQSEKSKHSDDLLLSKLWLSKGIRQDLLLLENQVPIFVLKKLYYYVVPAGNSEQPEHPSFLDLARKYFTFYYPQGEEIMLLDWKMDAKHFTDLVRYFHIPQDLIYDGDPPYRVLRTATKLKEAGVSFEAVSNRCLLDIKFKKKWLLNWFLCLGCFPCSNCVKARFQFPQLKVDDSTECILRNLIALEQCHYSRYEHYICNYVSVLDYLIHSKEDVELLVEKDVIVHELSNDKEMATMINGLCKHVVIAYTCYGKIIKELTEHYDNNWKRYMGVIRWVYFRDLWRISTTMVGLAVFLFTAVNFFRAIGVINVKL